MRQNILKLIKKALEELGVKLKDSEIDSRIEIPPSHDLGDYAFPCFFLAEKMKKSPNQIAIEIRQKIGTESATDFDDIQTQGPDLNFFLDRKNMARAVVWEAITQKKKYGRSNLGNKKKIVVEFSSPNIAKPLGVHHLRSTIIGNSLANIAEFVGYKVVKMNYIGDWGTQFGKIIFAYKTFGNEKKLLENPIKHLLELYIRANKKIYEEKSRECFKELEQGNKEAKMIWKLARELSLKEFKKNYKELEIEFDVYDAESLQNKKMKKVIEDLEKKGLLKKSKGAKIVDLKKYKLGAFLIQKTDGATLYGTRDLTTAISRYEKYKFDKMIYQVGQEQTLYFNQLFKTLELMGHGWAKNCIHSDHGLYLDKDGRRFATRKGKSIFMEDVLNESKKLAEKEIKKRDKKISKKELERRAHRIAIAAIFYGDLKNNKKNNMVFDLNKFVSFEGDTGPYLLYSYARASSILRKAPQQGKFEIYDLDEKELELVVKLSKFSDIVQKSFNSLSPSVIANYCYDISQTFNEFYHACPVLGSKEEHFRLALVEAFRQILRNSLGLLGIQTLEEM